MTHVKTRPATRAAAVLALAGLLSTIPTLVQADGGMFSSAPYEIYEPAQTAFIRYDGDQQQEDLHILPSFYGDAADFAWIVPVPAVPTIDESDTDLFYNLRSLTSPLYRTRDSAFSCDQGTFSPAAGDVQNTGVEIVTSDQVGIYDTLVISADEPTALTDSLQAWGYLQPDGNEDIIAILNHYVEQDWYFVTMKIDSTAFNDLYPYYDGYYHGQIQPIFLSFASDEIIYPMRISSISAAPWTDLALYVAAPHRTTFAGAETRYANMLTADELAYIRTHYPYAGARLASGDILTKLYRSYTPAEMENDIVLTRASTDEEYRPVYYSGFPATTALFASMGLGYGIWRTRLSWRRRQRRS